MLSVLLQTEQEQWNAERDSEKKTPISSNQENVAHEGQSWPWLGPGGL